MTPDPADLNSDPNDEDALPTQSKVRRSSPEDAMPTSEHMSAEPGSRSLQASKGSSETSQAQPREDETQPPSQSLKDQEFAESFVAMEVGRYEIRDLVGRGGFGAVYRAWDPQLERTVAVKIPRGLRSKEDEEDFLAEAKKLAQLRHNGIVTIHDADQALGVCFIVTDFIDGKTLSDLLRERHFTWQEATELVAKVADALAHAHAHGIVHRDIKPGNIMLNLTDEPILLDFGLATTDLHSIGPEELVAGTPSYMAPEQVQGLGYRIDGRTDIYALGVVLYRLLTGRNPFRSTSCNELMRRIVDDDPQPLRQLAPHVPERLARVVKQCMSKDIERRITTSSDLARVLREILASGGASGSADISDEESLDSLSSFSQTSTRRRREAEKRSVTIAVFNFESEQEGDDAETQHLLARNFREMCTSCAEEYGGMVVGAAGQEVMACFGFPVAYEDAARRATLAALLVREKADAWKSESNERMISTWAVVHSGQAVVEDSGEEVSVVGDARNVAARLETVVEPDEIVVTESGYTSVSSYFEFESLGSRRVRGIKKPIELYQVQSELHKDRLTGASDLTPLVGRSTELAILTERWEQASEGMGQVVLLIGDAGLGKSRLIHEIRTHVQSEDDTKVVEWRCSAYHQNTDLYPAIEFFERTLEFAELETPEERFAAIRRCLQDVNLDTDENAALLGDMLGVPLQVPALEFSPQKQRAASQMLLHEWLSVHAKSHPLLFVVEDLHWVDPTTLEMLRDHMKMDSRQMLSLLTFRPEFETPWKSYAHQTQIALNRLTKRQVAQMIKQRTGRDELPEMIVRQMVERTEGVPLFVEEFTKLAEESGLLDDTDDGNESDDTQSVLMEVIPASLQDLLVARMDRIGCNPEVLQLASVIGREFQFSLLEAAAELGPEALLQDLDRLVDNEIVFQSGHAPDYIYTFKHALIQDAAYQSMLTGRRQEYHLAVAESLPQCYPEIATKQPELLAQHYNAGGKVQEAIMQWQAAGVSCQGRCAHEEAIHHFRNALEAAKALPDAPEVRGLLLQLHLQLGVSLLATRGYGSPEAGPVYQRALELCEQVHSKETEFYVRWGVWAWRLVRGDHHLCGQLADEVQALATELPAEQGWVGESEFVPQVNGVFCGDFVSANRHGTRALEILVDEAAPLHAQHTGQDARPGIRIYHALAQWMLGHFTLSEKMAVEAIRIAREIDHPFTLCFVLHHGAWYYLLERQPATAEELAKEAIEVGEAQGFALWASSGQMHQGLARVHSGDLNGIEQLRGGLEAYAGTGANSYITSYYAALAESLLLANRPKEALIEADRSIERSKQLHGQNHFLVEAHRVRGDALQELGEHEEAAAAWQTAIETADAQQAWTLKVRTLCSRLRHDESAADLLRATLAESKDPRQCADILAAQQLL